MRGLWGRVVRRVRALAATVRRAPAPAMLSVSLLGWAMMVWVSAVAVAPTGLVLAGQGAGAHAGHGMGAGGDLAPAVVHTHGLAMWLAMVVAMSPLLLLREVSHISHGSLRRTRGLSLLVFASGYALVWVLAGLVAVPLVDALAGSLLLGVSMVTLAVVWQCSPLRRRCLNLCHRTPPLRIFGAAAQADAWRYGVVTGSACAAACGPVMALVLLATDVHLLAMAAATLMLTMERYLPARRPRWRLPLAPARPEHVALSRGPQVERQLSW